MPRVKKPKIFSQPKAYFQQLSINNIIGFSLAKKIKGDYYELIYPVTCRDMLCKYFLLYKINRAVSNVGGSLVNKMPYLQHHTNKGKVYLTLTFRPRVQDIFIGNLGLLSQIEKLIGIKDSSYDKITNRKGVLTLNPFWFKSVLTVSTIAWICRVLSRPDTKSLEDFYSSRYNEPNSYYLRQFRLNYSFTLEDLFKNFKKIIKANPLTGEDTDISLPNAKVAALIYLATYSHGLYSLMSKVNNKIRNPDLAPEVEGFSKSWYEALLELVTKGVKRQNEKTKVRERETHQE